MMLTRIKAAKEREQKAISERGPGDIGKLLISGDTWKIS